MTTSEEANNMVMEVADKLDDEGRLKFWPATPRMKAEVATIISTTLHLEQLLALDEVLRKVGCLTHEQYELKRVALANLDAARKKTE